jgi:hypothetical protein
MWTTIAPALLCDQPLHLAGTYSFLGHRIEVNRSGRFNPYWLARDGLGCEWHLAHHELVKLHLRTRVIYVYAYNMS